MPLFVAGSDDLHHLDDDPVPLQLGNACIECGDARSELLARDGVIEVLVHALHLARHERRSSCHGEAATAASRRMQRMVGTIVAIWIKRAHRLPLDSVLEARLVQGRGVEGSADQGGWRQITIISEEAWGDAVAELGREIDPSHRRANVMVRGIDLEDSRGTSLRLGGCVVNIRGENPPCKLMEPMRAALKPHWRAGVFGEIVEGGTIRVGEPATMEPRLQPGAGTGQSRE